jgi:hypothetical protein
MSDRHLSGYALRFDDVCGDPDQQQGWHEHIDRAALQQAVADKPTLPLIMSGHYLGEATLSVDDEGLRVDVDLALVVSFRVKQDTWDDQHMDRRISQLNLCGMELVRTLAKETAHD